MFPMAPKRNAKKVLEDVNDKKRDLTPPTPPLPKTGNTGPTPPAKSGSNAPAMATQETVNSTPDTENPNSRSLNLSSPHSTPKSRLNIDNDGDGAGWATDNDFRPKPIRPRFSDLKHIECQVAREVTTKLGLITQELDLGKSKTPKVLSQEDTLHTSHA